MLSALHACMSVLVCCNFLSCWYPVNSVHASLQNCTGDVDTSNTYPPHCEQGVYEFHKHALPKCFSNTNFCEKKVV